MITRVQFSVFSLAVLCCLLVLPSTVLPQAGKKPSANIAEREASKTGESDSIVLQRRSFAISLVTSLAEEARSYQSNALRANVLSRAADTLWPADSNMARLLFRRAWEAAENGDLEKQASKNNNNLPAMAIALREPAVETCAQKSWVSLHVATAPWAKNSWES